MVAPGSVEDVKERLQQFAHLPQFPDGRINYKDSPSALVVTIFLLYDDKILLVKRSDKVGSYRGFWNVVAGYVDEAVSIPEKAQEELREEIGLELPNDCTVTVAPAREIHDKGRTWITYAVLIQLRKKPNVKLDWEATEYAWILPEKLTTYNAVPGLRESWHLLSLISKERN